MWSPRSGDGAKLAGNEDEDGERGWQTEEARRGVQSEGGPGSYTGRGDDRRIGDQARRAPDGDQHVEAAGHRGNVRSFLGEGRGASGREGRRDREAAWPRSASSWWSGFFWREPPADERGPEAGNDRAAASVAASGAALRACRDQPVGMVRTEAGRKRAEPDTDAADRRAVSGNTVPRRSPDGAAASQPG